MLDIARIESRQLSMSLQAVPLHPLVEQAIELMRPLADSRSMAVHPPAATAGNGYVFADNQRLKQILINLISNAIKYRLLYVDDTAANITLIEEILERRPSVRLLPAMFGHLGLELAREDEPDLIVLDLHLPDLGGDEVLVRLKSDQKTRDIPVVILSADATKVKLEPLLAAGAAAYLTKPIAVRRFLQVVDEFLDEAA